MRPDRLIGYLRRQHFLKKQIFFTPKEKKNLYPVRDIKKPETMNSPIHECKVQPLKFNGLSLIL